jgi:hypothetical protein
VSASYGRALAVGWAATLESGGSVETLGALPLPAGRMSLGAARRSQPAKAETIATMNAQRTRRNVV